MTETTVHQAHFRVDANWLGEFIRTAYWYEHKHIYAKRMFDDMGLACIERASDEEYIVYKRVRCER